MNRHVLLASAFTLLIGGVLGLSCTTAQPALECSFLPLYWAQYKLVSGTGTCATYEGDRVDFQKYQPPGSTNSTFAFLPRRLGRWSRSNPCLGSRVGDSAALGGSSANFSAAPGSVFFRTDPSDPNHLKESPRGTYPSTLPNAQGFCAATSIEAAAQSFPQVNPADCFAAGINIYTLPDGGTQQTLSDGGVQTVNQYKVTMPKVADSYRDEWSDFRQLSTARFTGNIFDAKVTVTRQTGTAAACTATYTVLGFFPPVGCATVNGDEDCNPEPNLDKGRAVGSGIPADFASKCVGLTGAYEKAYIANFPGGINGVTSTVNNEDVDGVCVPTKTVDDLAALK